MKKNLYSLTLSDEVVQEVDALAAEVRRATTLIAFCRKRLLKAESDVKKITGE